MRKLVCSVAVAMLAACSSAPAVWSEKWSNSGAQFDAIAHTLSKNNIRGCGEFWYKLRDARDSGEAVVLCVRRRPFEVREFTVFYNTRGVNAGSEYLGPRPDWSEVLQ